MTLRIITQPSVEPITLAEAKLQCRVETTFTADDDLLNALITAVRQQVENLTRRALVQQTLELTLDCFPASGVIELPRPPLQSVTSVKFIDTDGTLTTVPASEYQVDTYREPGLVMPAYLESWDATRSDFNAVQVRYVAGYASGSPQDAVGLVENIPQALKHWMKVRINTLYNQREGINIGNTVSEIPRDFVGGLLDRYVVSMFG